MSVSITLPNDLEQFLQTYAHRAGVPLESLLTRTIVERWEGVRHTLALPTREAELLTRLQNLFPAEQTREYQALCQQSDAGTLNEVNRTRLLALIERRDEQNAERLQIIAELAKLRGVSLREMMTELEIHPD